MLHLYCQLYRALSHAPFIFSADAKMSYIYDDYVFHYMVDDGLTYLCLADEQQKRRIPFLFLADVRDKFVAAYGSRAKTAIAYAMPEFARTLADRMTFFNDNPAADSFGKVKDQLAEVKDVMVENIERVLARGEKIELLVDKSDQLNQSARKFQKSSKALKNVMWFKNVKVRRVQMRIFRRRRRCCICRHLSIPFLPIPFFRCGR